MNDALLQELIDAGTPPLLVAKVAAELGKAQGEREALERRRAADRARSQARRDRENASHVTLDHVTSRDVTDITDDGPAPSFPPNPPITPTPVSNNTHARGSRLTDDFEAPRDWIEWAIAERNWSETDARSEAENFRDYWHAKPGKDGRKLDWPATWRNWVRNSRRANGPGSRDGPTTSYAAMILNREQRRAQA